MRTNREKRLFHFETPISVSASASAVGCEEWKGPYGEYFDFHDPSDRFGAKTWELAEGEMAKCALNLALKKRKISHEEIDVLFAGDLQNQCMASSAGLYSFGIPYIGLYGACSTSVEGLLLAALTMNAQKKVARTAVVTSSHNCAAERQFRLPIEYGGQRTPTAQWTATAAGAFLLEKEKKGMQDSACIRTGMIGRAVDGGISDANNMGAAMAPAVCDSLRTYFEESGEKVEDFDLIVTGDLGTEGSAILEVLCRDVGFSLLDRHFDCGANLYDLQKQDAHAGGSGCGCIASMLAAYFVPKLSRGEYRRLLVLATGALMSPSSIQQGGSIIGIAPAIVMEYEKGEKKRARPDS